jgi:hypothetical protein
MTRHLTASNLPIWRSRCRPLKKSLNEALVGITASQEWRRIEDGYFGRQQEFRRGRGGEGRWR